MTLRSKLVRLAHEKPELRSALLPLLQEASEREAASPTDSVFVKRNAILKAKSAFELWRRAMTGGAATHIQEKAEQDLSDALGPLFDSLRA